MVICGKFFHVLIVACYVPVAPLGLRCTGFWRFYTPFTPLGLLEAGAQCAPYKCTFQTGSYHPQRTKRIEMHLPYLQHLDLDERM